ncbi:sugar ABC transporter permease, partial [Acinetobacter baumannii]
FVYDGDYGLIAQIWGLFGAEAPHLLADPDLAIHAILGVIVWKYFGFHMMLYIAGLQQIDRNLYEAAHMDGATGWQIFSRITVPLLGPTI